MRIVANDISKASMANWYLLPRIAAHLLGHSHTQDSFLPLGTVKWAECAWYRCSSCSLLWNMPSTLIKWSALSSTLDNFIFWVCLWSDIRTSSFLVRSATSLICPIKHFAWCWTAMKGITFAYAPPDPLRRIAYRQGHSFPWDLEGHSPFLQTLYLERVVWKIAAICVKPFSNFLARSLHHL